MARCTVTVAGVSIEVEATSLYRAVFEYNYRSRGFPGSELPLMDTDTPILVQAEGKPGKLSTTLRQAMAWANRQTHR